MVLDKNIVQCKHNVKMLLRIQTCLYIYNDQLYVDHPSHRWKVTIKSKQINNVSKGKKYAIWIIAAI